MSCQIEGCLRPEEGTSGYCATHNHEKRKNQRIVLDKLRKETEFIKKKIKPISDRKKKITDEYNREVKEWIKGKTCAVFKDRKATECHHKKGRIGYADQWARDNNIPLLLDKRFWLPVSHEAHTLITKDSQWAIQNGYSVKRNSKML